jgi:quercetin dioxygenase-like cupin family protein
MDAEEFEAALRREGFNDIYKGEFAPGTVAEKHPHDGFDARTLVVSGSCTETINGVPHAYGQGDVYFIPAGSTHQELIGPQGMRYVSGLRHLKPKEPPASSP